MNDVPGGVGAVVAPAAEPLRGALLARVSLGVAHLVLVVAAEPPCGPAGQRAEADHSDDGHRQADLA